MKNITYIFSQNRKINYTNNNSYAKDFYYGLHNFENKKDNEIEIIEYSEKKSFLYPFLLVFDKVKADKDYPNRYGSTIVNDVDSSKERKNEK